MHTIPQFLFSMILISTLATAPAQGGQLDLRVTKDPSHNSQVIHVQVDDVLLPDLLDEIQSRSGISFDIPDTLRKETLTLDVKRPDWTALVLRILEDYNQLHVWDRPSHLKHVFILDSDDGSLPLENESTPVSEPQVLVQPQIPEQTSPESDLSDQQLRVLASGVYRSPIPSEYFHNLQMKQFLERVGMTRVEDRTNLRLAMQVRKQAKKILRNRKWAKSKNPNRFRP